MFTPPPSPIPLPTTRPVLQRTDSGSDTLGIPTLSLDKPATPPLPSTPYSNSGKAQMSKLLDSVMDDKRRIARRTRWTVLLVPAVLLLVGLSSRYLARSSGFSELDAMISNSPPFPIHEHDVHHFAHKRSPQTATLSNPATPTESSLVNSQTPSSTSTVPQTSQTIPSVPDSSNPPTLPTPFPQPFDSTGATSNLSTIGCQNFFTNMTQSTDFRQCRPFSLLEQFSSEFIQQAQTNLTGLNILLFGICNTVPSFDSCVSTLSSYASLLQSACSKELSQNNDLVSQTLLGLQAYPVMRTAGCLVDQKTDEYCYAFAVHESNPADVYLYNLPLGQIMPNTTTPTCSACAGSVLSVYAEALKVGNDSKIGLEDTYESAAQTASDTCGSGYAQLGLASGATSLWMNGLFGAGKDGWIGAVALWSALFGMLLVAS